MKTTLNPYMHFIDQAREAMEFYKAAFGGTLTMSTFKDAGVPHDPAEDDHIMHAMLVADNGMVLMASDTPMGMKANPGATVSISLSGDNEAELKGYWEKLSADGTIVVPMDKAPWGDSFGMFTDKFGIEWLVNIAPQK